MYNDHQHQHPSTSFNIHGLFPQLSSRVDTSAWPLLRRIPSSNSWAVDVRSQLPPTSLLVSTYPSEKIWVRQLGWWHSIYMEKQNSCPKPPTRLYKATESTKFFKSTSQGFTFFVGPGRGLIFFSKSLGTSPASEKGISFENPKIDTYKYLPIHPSIYPNWPDPPLFLSGHPRNKTHRLGPFQLYKNKT